jgi:hypothetical protein
LQKKIEFCDLKTATAKPNTDSAKSNRSPQLVLAAMFTHPDTGTLLRAKLASEIFSEIRQTLLMTYELSSVARLSAIPQARDRTAGRAARGRDSTCLSIIRPGKCVHYAYKMSTFLRMSFFVRDLDPHCPLVTFAQGKTRPKADRFQTEKGGRPKTHPKPTRFPPKKRVFGDAAAKDFPQPNESERNRTIFRRSATGPVAPPLDVFVRFTKIVQFRLSRNRTKQNDFTYRSVLDHAVPTTYDDAFTNRSIFLGGESD